MSERRAIATAAAILMLGNVASRLLGVLRELVIADRFGATAATSSFVAASTVPTMVYDLLIGGAISAALVPVFSEYIATGREVDLRRAAGTVMVLVTAVLAFCAAMLAIVAPSLVSLLIPGLDPALQAQTVTLTRLALPAAVLLGLSGVTTALLNSRQIFTYPSFSVAVYNIGIICGALLFAASLGVLSLVIGVLVGATLHLALQLPALRRSPPLLSFDLTHPAVRRILRLYAPVALGLVVSQIGVVIDRNLASRTGDDSLAVMRFATTLVQFPVGMVITATSAAILPTLSRHAATSAVAMLAGKPGDEVPFRREAYVQALVTGLRMALLAIIPITALMITEREPLIRLLFQRGAFDLVATQRTAQAFLAYAPQLPFVAIDLILIVAFYARQNTRFPTIAGVAGVIVFLVSGIALIQPLGMVGLALANTIQHTFHALLMLAVLWPQIGGLRGYGLGWVVSKASLVTLAIGCVWWMISQYFLIFTPGQGYISLALYLTAAGLIWGILYCGLLYAWGVIECRLLANMVLSRLRH
jgi:putative peptidoglycan lipid II flippase